MRFLLFGLLEASRKGRREKLVWCLACISSTKVPESRALWLYRSLWIERPRRCFREFTCWSGNDRKISINYSFWTHKAWTFWNVYKDENYNEEFQGVEESSYVSPEGAGQVVWVLSCKILYTVVILVNSRIFEPNIVPKKTGFDPKKRSIGAIRLESDLTKVVQLAIRLLFDSSKKSKTTWRKKWKRYRNNLQRI